jgi:hypothetical protein
MICFGAKRIIMGPTAELGPIDPQIPIRVQGEIKWMAAFDVLSSYKRILGEAVRSTGRLEPYMLQLQKYDEREMEHYQRAIDLSEDIAVQSLKTGMMKNSSTEKIKKNIKHFLTPIRTKSHGRPIYLKEAQNCKLNVSALEIDDKLWENVYELYFRLNEFVSIQVSKSIESVNHAYFSSAPQNL